jgi:hypothetical protein
MSAMLVPDDAGRSARAPQAPLRIVFFMAHLRRYLRLFDHVIRLMLERGHAVHLVFEREAEAPTQVEEAWLREIEQHPDFSWGVSLAWRRDPWFRVARPVRAALDYVHFIRQGAARSGWLVARAHRRAPAWIRVLMRAPGMRSELGLRLAAGVLGAFDRGIPISQRVRDVVREQQADVVLVAPHLMPGSIDSQYARSTVGSGVPVVLCVPSWDNLSSKQLLRVVPDLVTVWNETQRDEAVSLHGIPDERVAVTGAQCFDHWFDWRPRPREEFCTRVGMDPAKPYVLYVGGALFPSAITEAEFCVRWIEAIRGSEDQALRDVGILIRPHPKRWREWSEIDFSEFDDVAVWPRGPLEMPVGQEKRADFFDSIFHSVVVVGINTSAMIEAGVIGRGVHTVLVPEFENSQELLRHFRYLADGGLLRVAADMDEHLVKLADVISGRDAETEDAARRFVSAFVRPNGPDVPATVSFVDAVERLARVGPHPHVPESRWLLALRPVLALGRIRYFLLRLRLKLRLELARLRP